MGSITPNSQIFLMFGRLIGDIVMITTDLTTQAMAGLPIK